MKGSRSDQRLLVMRKAYRRSHYFRAGEDINETGIYRIFHTGHRVSHENVLPSGQQFPRCNHCGDEVRFELIQRVPQLDSDSNFHSIKLYEIPHPRDEEDDQSSLQQVG